MVLSATQTRPSLRWSLYVCPYIASENPLRQSDSYHLNINSDTHNMLKSSILTNPASATSEGKTPYIRPIAFFAFGDNRRSTDRKMLDHIGCVANNVKKCFLQQKKSSN